MKDSKGRTKIGFEKHIFVCENLRAEEHPRSCCSEKGGTEIRMKFKEEIKKQGLYGKVRANSIAVILNGDTAQPDNLCPIPGGAHCAPNASSASPNVRAGGGSTVQ